MSKTWKTILFTAWVTWASQCLFGVAPKTDPLRGFAEFIASQLKEWKVPGAAVAIVKDGGVVMAEGFGLRDVKRGAKVTAKTLFAIGSCSKAFTAADVGILVDEGKLDWDTPVRSYLPLFKLQDPTASEQMTPRDLLCHRSGLPRHDQVWYGSGYSRQELFERLPYLAPNKGFRSTWQYQNLMVMTAGYLVEKVSGKSWEAFTRERILAPLGMSEANFSVTDSMRTADFALPYQEVKNKVQEVPFRNVDAIGPAGSINASASEMAQWVKFNLGKGKVGDKQIISEASLGQIQAPQMTVSMPLQYDELLYTSYAMGWMVTPYRGHLLLEHGGGIDGFSALVAFLPKDKLGVVVLTNLGGTPLAQIVAYQAIDRLLNLPPVPWSQRLKEQLAKAKEAAELGKKDEDKDRIPNTSPSHPLEDYVGEYENPGYGVIAVALEGGALKMSFHSFTFSASHYHYDVFKLADPERDTSYKVLFSMDKKGVIGSLSVPLEPSLGDIVFSRRPARKMLEKAYLQKFTGQYEILGTTFTVRLKGESTLVVAIPGQPELELVPVQDRSFSLKTIPSVSIDFKMDASGKVIEMIFLQPNGVFTAKRKE